jgi:hypothetical protein
LLRTALEREIASKVVKLDDVVRNTPLVLKLVVNYNRQQQIHSTPGRDGILGHQFVNKRLEIFALCCSQSHQLADFKENQTLLWFYQ